MFPTFLKSKMLIRSVKKSAQFWQIFRRNSLLSIKEVNHYGEIFFSFSEDNRPHFKLIEFHGMDQIVVANGTDCTNPFISPRIEKDLIPSPFEFSNGQRNIEISRDTRFCILLLTLFTSTKHIPKKLLWYVLLHITEQFSNKRKANVFVEKSILLLPK